MGLLKILAEETFNEKLEDKPHQLITVRLPIEQHKVLTQLRCFPYRSDSDRIESYLRLRSLLDFRMAEFLSIHESIEVVAHGVMIDPLRIYHQAPTGADVLTRLFVPEWLCRFVDWQMDSISFIQATTFSQYIREAVELGVTVNALAEQNKSNNHHMMVVINGEEHWV